jgi:hypothetical protein
MSFWEYFSKILEPLALDGRDGRTINDRIMRNDGFLRAASNVGRKRANRYIRVI